MLAFQCAHSAAPKYPSADQRHATDMPVSTIELFVLQTQLLTINDCTLLVVAAIIWDGLPAFVVMATTLKSFKKSLKLPILSIVNLFVCKVTEIYLNYCNYNNVT